MDRSIDPGVAGLRVSVPAAGVAMIELDRPARRNALDRAMLDGLPLVLRRLDADDEVRVIVLTGAGGSFCAGGDLDVIGDLVGESPQQARQRMAREFSSTSVLASSDKPTIAAIEGAAVGAGMGLALACDVRLGSGTTRFSSPFVKMALVPDFGVSWLLAQAVGAGRAAEIALTGRTILAAEALRIGLLDSIVDDPVAAAVAKGELLAAAPPHVCRATKRLIRAARGRSLDEAIDLEIDEQILALRHEEFDRRWRAWSEQIRRR
ncbi:enoyl-CoA hydratase/isomerase family protein [Dactylosporangium sp. NPDC000244]|uniref:enoyl-CoA hydratase/isomerase family protein n=1 Tax=Dactylosporangium sp. NPDC000244 TaxID=3154365 RepID=UPI003316CE55